MKITQSKKELYRDNCELVRQRNEAIAVSVHTRLEYEEKVKLIDEYNENIMKANKIIDIAREVVRIPLL